MRIVYNVISMTSIWCVTQHSYLDELVLDLYTFSMNEMLNMFNTCWYQLIFKGRIKITFFITFCPLGYCTFFSVVRIIYWLSIFLATIIVLAIQHYSQCNLDYKTNLTTCSFYCRMNLVRVEIQLIADVP